MVDNQDLIFFFSSRHWFVLKIFIILFGGFFCRKKNLYLIFDRSLSLFLFLYLTLSLSVSLSFLSFSLSLFLYLSQSINQTPSFCFFLPIENFSCWKISKSKIIFSLISTMFFGHPVGYFYFCRKSDIHSWRVEIWHMFYNSIFIKISLGTLFLRGILKS